MILYKPQILQNAQKLAALSSYSRYYCIVKGRIEKDNLEGNRLIERCCEIKLKIVENKDA